MDFHGIKKQRLAALLERSAADDVGAISEEGVGAIAQE
jgi:hypothetical protein